MAPLAGRSPDPPTRAIAAIGAVVERLGSLDGWQPGSLTSAVDPELIERARSAADRLSASGRLQGAPGDLGSVYEALLDPAERGAGAHYTPADVAAGIVERVIPDAGGSELGPVVSDPCCGGGAFLLAAADRLAAHGLDAEAIVGRNLIGDDLDPGALLIASSELRWWLGRNGGDPDSVQPRVGGGTGPRDGLIDPRTDPIVDVVIGNPPFRSQMRGANVRGPATVEALKERFGAVLGPYTDDAALFLVQACRTVRPGGRVALILPLSTLAARDAAAAREEIAAGCELEGLWVAGAGTFDAAVDVCAPVLRRLTADERGSDPSGWRPIRWVGRKFASVDADAPADGPAAQQAGVDDSDRRRASVTVGAGSSWSPHALGALGVPDPVCAAAGVLDPLIEAFAGFRDEYYGLVDHVIEGPIDVTPEEPRWPEDLAVLVTTGSIGVGACRWGERPTTFARTRFERPVVDRRSLAAAGGRGAIWVESTRGPKIVVSAQARVGRAAVDETGTWVGSTPSIVVRADPDRLWEIAAVICSPVATVAAAAMAAGSGRSATAVRHSTSTVKALPVPVDDGAWGVGARALRAGDLVGFASAMSAAYAVDPRDASELEAWWLAAAGGR